MSEPAGTPPVPEIPKPKLKTARGPKGKFVSKIRKPAAAEPDNSIVWIYGVGTLLAFALFIYFDHKRQSVAARAIARQV